MNAEERVEVSDSMKEQRCHGSRISAEHGLTFSPPVFWSPTRRRSDTTPNVSLDPLHGP